MFLNNNMVSNFEHLGNVKSTKTRELLNANSNDMDKKLIKLKLQGPIITIPTLEFTKNNTLSKNFVHDIDLDFKTRSSQLPDSYFKDSRTLISVKEDNNLTGIYDHFNVPSDSYKKQDVEPIIKKNNLINVKTSVCPYDSRVDSDKIKVKQRNVLKNIPLDSCRESGGKTPIIQIKQHKEKIIQKS
tara:strand:+ start:1849 stop:2406 length:558 start_codon:yes stop_codon:yes gene_type:complete